MRRKIELYIDGSLADLSDQGLVLFNYAFTDMENPAAVKNSYSKQVTLPGTPANDIIFGHYYRTDRVTGNGFDALRKTPFAIYAETGEILESGYLRLDGVVRKGGMVTGYKVSLFGGLGSFFYSLSYDADGNKRTLADLWYLENDPAELDFTILASKVQEAWNRIAVTALDAPMESVWDVINFAPAYNGVPDGNFSADKAVVKAADAGLSASVTEEGETYSAQADGSVLVNLAQPHTEWEVKDLRCYLQRPVLRMRAFLDAITHPESNGGYEVEIDPDLYAEASGMWKTLPMLPSIGSLIQRTGAYHLDTPGTTPTTSGDKLYLSSIQETVAPSTEITAEISANLCLRMDTAAVNSYVYPLSSSISGPGDSKYYHFYDVVIFTQLLAQADGSILAGSDIHCSAGNGGFAVNPQAVAEALGYSPLKAADYEPTVRLLDSENGYKVTARANDPTGNWINLGGQSYRVTASGAKDYYLAVACYLVEWSYNRYGHNITTPSILAQIDCGLLGRMRKYSTVSGADTSPRAAAAWTTFGRAGGYTLTYKTSSEIRSGALVSKSSLLSSKHTPAEYLVSLVKILGGVFLCDHAAKKVSILSRNAFFDTGEQTIDLSGRIDRSKDIPVSPVVFTSKWYDFVLEQAQGTFAVEYKASYGIEYGIQRVNTGYDFDAATVDVMQGSAFRQAVTVLERGPYYNSILVNGSFRPSVFIDPGNTYTLWSETDGKNKEFPIQRPPSSAAVSDMNVYNPGYDSEFAWKLQLHDKGNKALDGEDILVYYSGRDLYPYFKLSDDSAVMAAVNEGKMCWDLTPGPVASTFVADFHRYRTDTEFLVERSLDFGTPREVDIPGANFADGSGRYSLAWAGFIRDRYDRDTKVMKCRVDLRGLQVGPELLRRFFWYEGSIWVLNKISNYSLTTWDSVECEFIQVRDVSNYTNGQNFE